MVYSCLEYIGVPVTADTAVIKGSEPVHRYVHTDRFFFKAVQIPCLGKADQFPGWPSHAARRFFHIQLDDLTASVCCSGIFDVTGNAKHHLGAAAVYFCLAAGY